MRRLLRGTIGIGALLAALGGCSVAVPHEAPADTRPERLPKMTLDCIFVHTVDDWTALDDYSLLIYAPTRTTAYRIELETSCHALRQAERIGISSHQDGRLCSFGGDALLVGGQRCTIGAIRPYKTGGDPEGGAGKDTRNGH